jgi:hypothetical protein
MAQLGKHEPGLNCFAEADLVGQQQARRKPSHNSQRRLELKGKEIDSGIRSRAKLSELAALAEMRLQKMPPAPARNGAHSTLKFSLYWTIERVEKCAIAPVLRRINAGQPQQRAVRKCNGFFDKPTVPANIDDVAGRKRRDGHARC